VKIARNLDFSGKLLVTVAGWMTVAVLIVFGLIDAAPSRAQAQNSAAVAPVFEYEVASIKPSKPQPGGMIMMGSRPTPDGFTATNQTLKMLVQRAYGVNDYQVEGGPNWLGSDRYDIDAKMDGPAADALQKLTPEEQTIARQKMLQALLADRLKLTIHRDTKELPIYTLIIGKNGSKLQESKPDAANPSPDGSNGPGGRGGRGISMIFDGGARSMTAKASPISNLVSTLSGSLGRPVLDKTGLTGKYDFTLKWSPDESQMQAPPGGAGPPNGPAPIGSPDSGAPTLLIAIQEQLGLKLESGKGPVVLIVIDHIEKPSEN
jgi:uncharacterized protein (TIGR03435 family)